MVLRSIRSWLSTSGSGESTMHEQVGQPDIDKMISACRERFAPPADWKPFAGYPDGLALS